MAARRRDFLYESLALPTIALGMLAGCAPPGPTDKATPQAGTNEQPKPGGTLRLALYQEPAILNPFINRQTAGSVVMNAMIQGLLDVDENGNRVPQLALEVPTVQNGGVSADGKTITYKLRPDVKWHDGKPFTARDVVFTYEAVMDTSNPVTTRVGYSDMASVEAKDEHTVVVQYKELFAPYLTRFDSILPAHVFGGRTGGMDKHEFGRHPIGTGPFKFVEWVSGDHITVARNPDTWQKGRPYLDQVIFRITPSREVAVAQLMTAEADVVWDLIESQIPDFDGHADIAVWAYPGVDVERLVLNLSPPSGPNQGDPNARHPILGDPKVREAIELAINKKVMVDKLLYGKTTVGTSPLPTGWAAPKLTPSEFNPDKAKRLLDEAGWRPGADGIRVKDGVRAAMTFSTTSGNQLRELTQQVMQEMLQAVGIGLEIRNMPSPVLLGSWADNSPRAHGNFDINMWTTSAGVDPHAHLFSYFHSSQIPSRANGGEGYNYARLKDDVVDRALVEAGATVDQNARKAAYERAIRRIVELRPHIFLYDRLDVDGARKYVRGHTQNPWDNVAWDIENWWLAK
ncbi:MAG TPA: peptide ABC transporter substrate-binding protein [Chloroflexota bacterium]|nr:peptide ABC transporter substrate-binding protein [Chloroflexota bacterium]